MTALGIRKAWHLAVATMALILAGAWICPMAEVPVQDVVQPIKSKSPSKGKAKKSGKHVVEDSTINKQEVQELYHAGDFDKLIALLESVRHERVMRDREDSIFIYKYLGVVYGADMATRRKAEAFLYQMLKLDPKQDLVDLEVGDAILHMFREVRKRFDRTVQDTDSLEERDRFRRNLKAFGYPIDSSGHNLINVSSDSSRQAPQPVASATEPGKTPSISKESAATGTGFVGDRTWMWVAGGAAAVTLGGVAVILLMSGPDTKTITYTTELK